MGHENARKSPGKGAPPPQILLKADAVTLTATADKEGKVRLKAGAWDEAVVLLPGQMMELRWRDGQVVLLRREASK